MRPSRPARRPDTRGRPGTGDDILDRIDEIVPPGTDVGTLDQAYLPPARLNPSLRRRPAIEQIAT
jgi:hypothetical protein